MTAITSRGPSQKRNPRISETPKNAPITANSNPDHAWKALSLVVDWVRFADAKAAGTLAGAGVSGGVLFNLVKDVERPGIFLISSAAICGTAAIATAVFCALVLWPRLGKGSEPTSLLYFDHIAQAHTVHDTYVEQLLKLTTDLDALGHEIAKQGWANSVVARSKYYWGGWAIRSLFVTIALLALTAIARTIS